MKALIKKVFQRISIFLYTAKSEYPFFNKEQNLNLSSEQIMHVIEKTDLRNLNHRYNGDNPLMLILQKNKEQNLNLSPEQIMQVIEKTYLSQQDENGDNSLMLILQNNKEQNLNLSKKKYNLSKKNYVLNPLLFILTHNKEQNLNLSPEQIMQIIDKSDLSQQNQYGEDSLMLILQNNKEQNLNFSPEQIMQFIEKSDLNQQDNDGFNCLMYILKYNQEQNLNLSQEQIMQVMVKTNNVFDILKNNDLGSNSMTEECFLTIIQEKKLGAQAIQYILDPDLQNKLPITSKTLTAIIDNLQHLNLENKKKIGKEFDYFISEMNRLYPDSMNHLDDNHKNIISSLQVLSRKPTFEFLNHAREDKAAENALSLK
jgi:hypothetical protein